MGGATKSVSSFVVTDEGFNAARGFVGGATKADKQNPKPMPSVSMPHAALWVVQQKSSYLSQMSMYSFNAARGFVGGAT